MSKKRKLAVKWSVEGLVQTVKGGLLRMWTFTTVDEVHCPKEIGRRWSAFACGMQQALDRRATGSRGGKVTVKGEARRWGGVRVSEPHPHGHGWHIHMVTASWLPVALVREMAERYGFGRVHVAKPCKGGAEALGAYLSKYLGKALDSAQGTGARMWSYFGYGKDRASRLRDIGVEAPRSGLWKALYQDHVAGGASYWTASCAADVGCFRAWWADVTGDGPGVLVNPF